MKSDRRQFLATTLAAAGYAAMPGFVRAGDATVRMANPIIGGTAAPPLKLEKTADANLTISSIEVLQKGDNTFFVRVTTSDGSQGIVHCSPRIGVLLPLMKELIMPFYLGRVGRKI